MITIKNLNKSYGKLHVLHNINLQLEKGQCIGFVGPNGCGKTTLMKCILGLATPQSGEVIVNGMNIQDNPSYRQHIGFMQQNSCFPENMSVRETFKTIEDVRSTNVTLDKELYEAYAIDKIAEKKTKTLSGGTSQKVNAALAFLFNPDILILDEPTASLDPLAANILKEKIVKEKDKLVFITSHILSELEGIVTHIIFMEEGHILFFKPVDELLKETQQDNVSQAVMYYLKKSRKQA
ncbi:MULTISPECIES: ABC transporter ATP-binding protein [Prevotella]|jgi:putative ABC transporter|uniref:ABC transporter ATP-binding protein n=1 Tax=Prevotella sp. TaxID=59823 RepID=UPI001CB44B96|nr:ABC transporter ATP-binding protein [Prevotella sp.]MBF1639476.1 ABC transporter ATP-binding protein [Prevotella sp.]